MNYASNNTNEDASNADLLDCPIYPPDFQDVEVKDEPLEPDTVSCKHILQNLIFKQYFGRYLLVLSTYFYLVSHNSSVTDIKLNTFFFLI